MGFERLGKDGVGILHIGYHDVSVAFAGGDGEKAGEVGGDFA